VQTSNSYTQPKPSKHRSKPYKHVKINHIDVIRPMCPRIEMAIKPVPIYNPQNLPYLKPELVAKVGFK